MDVTTMVQFKLMNLQLHLAGALETSVTAVLSVTVVSVAVQLYHCELSGVCARTQHTRPQPGRGTCDVAVYIE